MNPNIDPGTLTKAVLRAADHLGLTADLPSILGLSPDIISSMMRGERTLDSHGSEWERAKHFASLFRSLLTLTGTAENARSWLTTVHHTLGAAPRELLRTSEGLERVLKYLDSVQKYEIKLPQRGDAH